jgi:hypothetical protein
MSRSNGERSLADISRKRRTAQRVKDRALRASLGVKPAAPAASPAAASVKPAAKPAKG